MYTSCNRLVYENRIKDLNYVFYVLVNLCILVATDWFMKIESRIEIMFFMYW